MTLTTTAPNQTVSRPDTYKEFAMQHSADIKRDFALAARHMRSGEYRLTITPNRIACRVPDKSSLVMDLQENCRESMWLKKLYRDLCPSKFAVSFDYNMMLSANCGDHLEDVWMLVVIVHA